MHSSPHVGLFIAISTINFRTPAGTRGRPRGRDFHFQNNRNPLRCQRISVSSGAVARPSPGVLRKENGVNGVTSEIRKSQIVDSKSGRRGSNPRRPAWENGRRLNLKNNRAYGMRFWLRKSLHFLLFGFDNLLMRYKWDTLTTR